LERDANAGDNIPGCGGRGYEDNNYCIKAPSGIPSGVPSPCYGGSGMGYLEELGLSPDCPLKECAGDCDEDHDCISGLICLQRSSDDIGKIRSCEGQPFMDYDYCIEKSLAPTSTPTQSPSITHSDAPSVLHSVPPTQSPTITHSMAPSVYNANCVDSALKFKFNGKILRCKKITLISDDRCEHNDVKSHCPQACRKCDSHTCSDSTATFYYEKKMYTCANANLKNCWDGDFLKTCRAACKGC